MSNYGEIFNVHFQILLHHLLNVKKIDFFLTFKIAKRIKKLNMIKKSLMTNNTKKDILDAISMSFNRAKEI